LGFLGEPGEAVAEGGGFAARAGGAFEDVGVELAGERGSAVRAVIGDDEGTADAVLRGLQAERFEEAREEDFFVVGGNEDVDGDGIGLSVRRFVCDACRERGEQDIQQPGEPPDQRGEQQENGDDGQGGAQAAPLGKS
jgi:hypothetical protein